MTSHGLIREIITEQYDKPWVDTWNYHRAIRQAMSWYAKLSQSNTTGQGLIIYAKLSQSNTTSQGLVVYAKLSQSNTTSQGLIREIITEPYDKPGIIRETITEQYKPWIRTRNYHRSIRQTKDRYAKLSQNYTTSHGLIRESITNQYDKSGIDSWYAKLSQNYTTSHGLIRESITNQYDKPGIDTRNYHRAIRQAMDWYAKLSQRNKSNQWSIRKTITEQYDKPWIDTRKYHRSIRQAMNWYAKLSQSNTTSQGLIIYAKLSQSNTTSYGLIREIITDQYDKSGIDTRNYHRAIRQIQSICEIITSCRYDNVIRAVKASAHSYKLSSSLYCIYLYALITLDECDAWFHLYGLRRAVRIAKQAKYSKWKYMSRVEIEPVTHCFAGWRLRPLGQHNGRLLVMCERLTQSLHMNKINVWQNMYHVDYG